MEKKNDVLNYLRSLHATYLQSAKRIEEAIQVIEQVPEITIQSPSFDGASHNLSNMKLFEEVKEVRTDNTTYQDGLPLQQRILNLLAVEKRFIHSSEIAEKLGVNTGTLSSRLSKMVKGGELKRVQYNNHFVYIFYGLDDFIKNEAGKIDFKDSSYEPVGEKTKGMSRSTATFS